MPKLKVASDWHAPLERNHYEVAWLRRAQGIVPGAVPRVVAEDAVHGVALLEYLPPDEFVLWKAELLAGRSRSGTAKAVADVLGKIHAATLFDDDVAAEFPTDHLIEALRLDPYLRATAAKHPVLSDRILSVLATTAQTKMALVHGDVSPKNILIAKADDRPVLLDAECAWYGDPAFDGAFLLNHLVLKSIHLPALNGELIEEARVFLATWVGYFPANQRESLETRTAALLPCLMLARVDGKSPVEYLGPDGQARVRDIATPLIRDPVSDIRIVFDAARLA